MSTKIWSKTFFGALALAALTVTAFHGISYAKSASEKVREKFQSDENVILGDISALDYRRTLFAPFGQKTLVLEAPLGMCFLDETDYTERQAMRAMRDILKDKSKHTLVALFADCLQISSIGQASEQNPLADLGVITWPVVPGEKVPADLREYLSLHEDYMENNIKNSLVRYVDLHLDAEPKYTDFGITQGYTADFELSYQKMKAIGVAGTTLIRGLPVAINISHTGAKLTRSHEELYTIMDKMLEQQVALNAVE